MIKRFFLAFLGSMAAIWMSVLLGIFLLIAGIVAAIGSIDSTGEIKSDVKSGSVLILDLSGEIVERKNPTKIADAIYGKLTEAQTLNDITAAIYRAAHDSRIKGIYVDCSGAMAGIASLQAIEEAIGYFKSRPDKWVMAYADTYTQGDYYTVSGANEIWLNPIGAVDIHGLSATTLFYTGLLDKMGVKMQVLRVGTFKSAVEPYILKDMSPASRMQQEVYMNSIWDSIKDRIAENRGKTPETVDRWADELVMTSPTDSLLADGIVTTLGYRHQAERHVAELAGKDKYDDVNTVSVKDYVTAVDLSDYSYLPDVASSKKKDRKTIAVLYAAGEITDSGDSGITGDKMTEQILDLADNDDSDLAGLVLRVNSPGGSAFASEQIWEALEQFKERTGLPLYVSMGDVAASGGYYISCGADVIYAQPATLTGSIGIYGMIPEISGLVTDKLGVNTATVSTNSNGNFPSLLAPMTPAQKEKMQRYIERGYDLFTRRCAEGRHISQDSIKTIAEGRVWDGATAQQIGLVDRLGSLHTAITGMAADLGLKSYQVATYPKTDSKWWEELLEMEDLAEVSGIDSETLELYRHLHQIKNAPRVQSRMETIVIK